MRFINQKNLGLAAACAFAFSGAAFANDKDHDAMFKSMDTNGDEKISADEHAESASAATRTQENRAGRAIAPKPQSVAEAKP